MPFYHAVEDEPKPYLKHAYPVKTAKAFEKDLDELLHFFEPVDTETLMNWIQDGQKPAKRSFWLSFDDGLSSFYTVAAPILKRKGIPAACFVNTDFIDNKGLFFRYKAGLITEQIDTLNEAGIRNLSVKLGITPKRDLLKDRIQQIAYTEKETLDQLAGIIGFDFGEFLRNEQPYLTSDQINSLLKDGFTIGAHSLDHPKYNEISPDEQVRQTILSVSELEKRFKIKDPLFSFPFTDDGLPTAFFKNINKNPGSPVITFGTAGMKRDQITSNLQRIPMEFSSKSAMDIIRTEYVYYVLKSFVGKNKLKRH